MSEFDFNEWSTLYAVDPAAFEAKKEAVLTRLVQESDADSQLSLEQTLFRIRMTSKRAKSPLQAAMESSKLMWESFGKLREKLDELNSHLAPTPEVSGPNSLRLVSPDKQFDQSKTQVSKQFGNPVRQATVLEFRASSKPAH